MPLFNNCLYIFLFVIGRYDQKGLHLYSVSSIGSISLSQPHPLAYKAKNMTRIHTCHQQSMRDEAMITRTTVL